ncbi:dopamine D2-like receptor, partial [Aphis craccivora]
VCSCVHRYIAVTQPIKYAKHKNNRRVWLTIVLVWAISAAIGSPIVLGLNNTPDREPDLCVFYNSNFVIYSSLSSFYIPCIIMVFLYWNIFKVSPVIYYIHIYIYINILLINKYKYIGIMYCICTQDMISPVAWVSRL